MSSVLQSSGKAKSKVIRLYPSGVKITYTEGRIQPYTIWRDGMVVRFMEDMDSAVEYSLYKADWEI